MTPDLAAELRARAEKARAVADDPTHGSHARACMSIRAEALDEAASLVESRENRGDHPGETVAESSQEARVEFSRSEIATLAMAADEFRDTGIPDLRDRLNAALRTIGGDKFALEPASTRVREDDEARVDECPTCGSPVEVVTSDEGTSHYRPASTEQEGEDDA